MKPLPDILQHHAEILQALLLTMVGASSCSAGTHPTCLKSPSAELRTDKSSSVRTGSTGRDRYRGHPA